MVHSDYQTLAAEWAGEKSCWCGITVAVVSATSTGGQCSLQIIFQHSFSARLVLVRTSPLHKFS